MTRQLNDSIPLTKGQEIKKLELENTLKRIVMLSTFLSIVKKFNDRKAPPSCLYESFDLSN